MSPLPARFLTAMQVGRHAERIHRPLREATLDKVDDVLTTLPRKYLDAPSQRAAAVHVASALMVRLLAIPLDPDLTLDVVTAQLTLLGHPLREPRALYAAYCDLVDTGLNFRLSTAELVDRARPLIEHAIA